MVIAKLPIARKLTLLAGLGMLESLRNVASNKSVALHQQANLFHEDDDSTSQRHLVDADYWKSYEQSQVGDVDESECQVEEL